VSERERVIELIYAVVVYQPGRCTAYIKKEVLIRERVDRESRVSAIARRQGKRQETSASVQHCFEREL
jgi:hypothetical protein